MQIKESITNIIFDKIIHESVEDDLARIETGGFEAFRNEDYVDPGKARAIHQAAQNAGMSDLDYVNNEERLDELFNEDLFKAISAAYKELDELENI